MKYLVYAIYTASKLVGEFEADSEEAAKDMAAQSGEDWAQLCHQCSGEIELGDDPHDYQAEVCND